MNTENNLIGLVVALAVSVILIGSVLMLAVNEASATEDTFKNDGYFHLKKYTSDDELTLEWDSTVPDTFTVNGETIIYHNGFGLAQSIVLGEAMTARLNDNNARISFYSAGNFINTSETNPTFTLTYSAGTVVVSNVATTRTYTDVAELYAISDNGDYVMKKATSPAYLNSGSEIVADSEIYASGQTYNGNANVFWHLEGTIDDMEYPDTFNSNLTVSDEAINGKYDSSHEDLYVLNDLTFKITNTVSGVVFNVTASYFIVPSEVTAERSAHMNDGEIALIAVIPVLIIASLVVIAVRSFNRD